MNNNKGVTLVELLIVIVVMGIIALFAVPAVGNILDNVGQDKLIADATVLEDQLDIICLDLDCTADGFEITWGVAKGYVTFDDPTYYNLTDDATGDAIVVATYALATDDWDIVLMPPAANTTDLGWPSGMPSDFDTKLAKRGNLDTN